MKNSLIPLALLAALTTGCSRPPQGMRRLDSGSSNHWFTIDPRLGHLYYMEGGGSFLTRLGVVDLDDGRRRTYAFPHQKIVGLRPAAGEDAVKLATEGTGESNTGEYKLLLVDSGSGQVRVEEKPKKEGENDLAFFAEATRPDDPAPSATPAFAVPASTAARGDDGSFDIWYKTEGGARPGVRTAEIGASRRSTRFFPTPTEPVHLVYAPGAATAYAAYAAPGGAWKIEEFRASTGSRRIVATVPTEIESMAAVGLELAALRRDEGGGGRRLMLIDPAAGRVALELPWGDGESDILAVDPRKRLMYVRMHEGQSETCWSVHFDEAALRAASAYLARNRGSGVRKFTDSDALALGMTGGMVLLFAAIMVLRES